MWPLRGCAALFSCVLLLLYSAGPVGPLSPPGEVLPLRSPLLYLVGAFFALTCFSFVGVSSAEASGAPATPSEEGWLWPLGQAGEVPGQAGAPAPPTGRPLRVVILTIGTRGDVQPFIALGQHLRDAGGHRVTIATVGEFQGAVEAAGLTFAATGIPRIEQPPEWARMATVAEMVASLAPTAERDFLTLGAGLLAAVRTPALADVVLGTSHTLTYALNIGEATGVPVWLCKLAPDIPTAAAPPPGFSPSPVGLLNLAKGYWYWVSTALAWSRTNLGACENQFRATLGLGPVAARRRLEETRFTPQLLGFSRALLPAPLDYPEWAFQCGFWLTADGGGGLYDPHLGQVPRAARVFFTPEGGALHGARAACVTMGSMAHGGAKLSTVTRALLDRGLRVVVLTGGSEAPTELLEAAREEPARLLVLPAVPHDWLFPLCSLVVHHGGAGTTSRALAAGVPSLVIPALPWSDQPLWGELAEGAGVGVLLRGECANPSRASVEAALNTLFAGSKAEAPHTGSLVAEGANRKGAALRAERAAAAAAMVLTGCLCKIVLPADGSAREEVARMCQRNCVPCAAERRAAAAAASPPRRGAAETGRASSQRRRSK
jgi:sterol 3beta-glucosyltransferase